MDDEILKANDDVRIQHKEFVELCVLSGTDSLTIEEQGRLRVHLAQCRECSDAMREFDAVEDLILPVLIPRSVGEDLEKDSKFSLLAAERSFRKRLSEEKEKEGERAETEHGHILSAGRGPRRFYRYLVDYEVWLPLAASVLLCTALVIMSYRIGESHGKDIGRSAKLTSPAMLDNARDDRKILEANERIASRDKEISDLRQQILRKSLEVSKMKAAQTAFAAASKTEESQLDQVRRERERLSEQSGELESSLDQSKNQILALEQQNAQDAADLGSLKAQVAAMPREEEKWKSVVDRQQELLSHDSEIRELMGARDLLISDVYDVTQSGTAVKAFGRIFYTKGKSLIFYAYDLSDIPGAKEASTFQAWGGHGANDRKQTFRLGIFYEDNVAKKRWVLKSNDRKALNEIDVVFITVEPRGGSPRPTGKPFLMAYLKQNANHP